MSLARAFTTRRAKKNLQAGDGDFLPQRSNTTKISSAAGATLRHKISSPVELIHTTNMLSYNAPDIPKSATSSASSTRSDDDLSDGANYTTVPSPPTSPDIPASRESTSPEPNHLSCYFTPPTQKSSSTSPALATKQLSDAPAIPSRSPSHTKKASYEALNRARSVSRLSEQSSRTVSTKASFTFSRSSSGSTSVSTTSHNSFSTQSLTSKVPNASLQSSSSMPITTSVSAVPEVPTISQKYQHPFGKELAQVSEIAEEYGVRERLIIVDAEEQELAAKGLFKFGADDYLSEIQSLFSTIFASEEKTSAILHIPTASIEAETVWI